MLLPDPEAQQLATHIGWHLNGKWGGIAAGGLFVLPSVFILWGLAWLYVSLGTVPMVTYHTFMPDTGGFDGYALGAAVIAFIGLQCLKWGMIPEIAGSAAAGYILNIFIVL
jgi:hypothetical protein